MKTGDKLVCINDAAGEASGIKSLKRGSTYTLIQFSNCYDDEIFVNDGTTKSWNVNRFRKLETYTAKETCVNFNTVEEGLEISVPEKVKA